MIDRIMRIAISSSNKKKKKGKKYGIRPVTLERELKYSQKLLSLGYFTVEKIILYSRLLG